ncbi:hypothetical protein [Pontibacter chitinilyticus]|uniref:hypothetical protein n=1 Tax=Pontibacter chitinilyticus TaxID=2674989 RepID=UPI0032190F88
MRKLALPLVFAALVLISCNRNKNALEHDSSEATDASEAGEDPVPADVLLVTKPLISGHLYSRPSFEGMALAHFDTAQLIQVLDTSETIFVKARILKDTSSFTGYVSRAILPEK